LVVDQTALTSAGGLSVSEVSQPFSRLSGRPLAGCSYIKYRTNRLAQQWCV